MKNLEQIGFTPKVNKHMTHAEDLVILGGKDGFSWIIKFISDFYDYLRGLHPKNAINLSVKIDGAPAIFAWSKFPGLDNYGIATKGLFAKDPKALYSDEDIDLMYGDKPQLSYKLKSFLEHVKSIEIPDNEIWQGDFLFDDRSFHEVEIEGIPHYAFHANTIYYCVDKSSDISEMIRNANVGLVWHTRYTGESLESVQASYDVNINELKPHHRVFMIDPYIKYIKGIIEFTDDESDEIEKLISELKRTKNLIDNNLDGYSSICDNKELVSLFLIFCNSLIKTNSSLLSGEFNDNLIRFIRDRYLKEEEKKKTEAGKKSIMDKAQNLIFQIEKNKESMELIVLSMGYISDIKQLILKKLDSVGKFKTYLKIRGGDIRKTGQEGFAVSDKNGNVVKLIDRKEFSWSNFSPDVLKGWE